MEHAQQTLKNWLQAHGEALTHLLTAWEKRAATQLPSAQDLGGRVSASVRAAWAALSPGPKGDAAEALLRWRLRGSADPAEHIAARRMRCNCNC